MDTSVWSRHFSRRSEALDTLLQQDRALMHCLVLGEIACGTPPAPRAKSLEDLAMLTMLRPASLSETLELIERESLFGFGCGLVDTNLLASTLLSRDVELWTLDKRLEKLAKRFGVAHRVTS